jgi:hypothetical protein
VSIIKKVIDSEQDERSRVKKQLMSDQVLINNFRNELKNLERLVRIFEITYLDLSEKLQETLQEKNMNCVQEVK